MLLKTAALAGEIMLKSGAEAYRVEDMLNRILKLGGTEVAESYVLSTGFMISVAEEGKTPVTLVRRVRERETDLNRIYEVNNVSRGLCQGKLTLEEAYDRLNRIKEVKIYKNYQVQAGLVGIGVSFTALMGGSAVDVLTSLAVGIVLMLVLCLCRKTRQNSILGTTFGSFALAFAAYTIQAALPGVNGETVIIGCIMPLVPGMAFTNALRDITYGDYISGGAKITEAILVAAAVAAGVACGIAVFRLVGGVL